jgi:hypothetical protein
MNLQADKERWNGRLVTGLLVACVAVAVVLSLTATRNSSDIGPDAVLYLNGATNIASGHGYRIDVSPPAAPDDSIPVYSEPPVYAHLVAAAMSITGSAEQAARWLSIISRVISILAVFWIAARLGGQITGVLAALLVTVYSPLVWMSSLYLTDAFFTALLLGVIVGMIQYLDSADRRQGLWLLLLIVLAVTCMLTRYVGGVIMACTALIIVLNRRNTLQRRLLHGGLLLATVVLCVGPWFIYVWTGTGYLTGYPMWSGGALSGPENLALGLRSLAPLLPLPRLGLRGGDLLRAGLAGLLLATAVLVFASGLIARRGSLGTRLRSRLASSGFVVVLAYLGAYLGFFLVMGAALRAGFFDWPRYLAPATPLLLVLASLFLVESARVATDGWRDRPRQAAAVVLGGILVWSYLSPAIGFAARGAAYQGFDSPEWRESAGLAYLSRVAPRSSLVFSEQPTATLYRLGRPVKGLVTLADLERALRSVSAPAYLIIYKSSLAFVDPFHPRDELVTAEAIERFAASRPELRRVSQSADSDVYELHPGPAR